jgi:hypothetical protein
MPREPPVIRAALPVRERGMDIFLVSSFWFAVASGADGEETGSGT